MLLKNSIHGSCIKKYNTFIYCLLARVYPSYNTKLVTSHSHKKIVY